MSVLFSHCHENLISYTDLAQNINTKNVNSKEKLFKVSTHWNFIFIIHFIIQKQFPAYLCHIDEWCLTGGACIVTCLKQFFKTCSMQKMATFRNMARNPWCVDVLEAHRTIWTRDILHTLSKQKQTNYTKTNNIFNLSLTHLFNFTSSSTQ
jgi:hypothetical protein